MKKTLATVLLAALLTLTACEAAEPPEDTVSAGSPSDTAQSSEEISRLAMELTFDNASPEDQRSVCLGLELYGREQSKENLQALVPPQDRDQTDWDAAVDYLIERCALR